MNRFTATNWLKKILLTGMLGCIPLSVCVADDIVEEYGNSFNISDQQTEVDQPTEGVNGSGKAWFRDAGLGLFLHWGIHALMEQQPSWCMLAYHQEYRNPFFHPQKYYSMAPKFDPQIYDVDLWLGKAKEAGFTYAVMTTKHHDGYALWPSEYGELNTGVFLDGRDLLKPYVEACRKHGLRVGFYFSGVDWYHKDFPRQSDNVTGSTNGLDYTFDGIDYSQWRRWPDGDPEEVKKHLNGFYDMAKGQLKELLTHYGQIDILWFDGFPKQWPASLTNADELVEARIEDIHRMIRELQPDIVINNRGGFVRGLTASGDFSSLENAQGGPPPGKTHPLWRATATGRMWELCNVWGRGAGWGYTATGFPQWGHYWPASWVLKTLTLCRARGGNMLTNSAPSNNGRQPQGFYRECDKLAEWMKHSRASLIGAGALKGFWEDYSNVPVTTGENLWYLHLLTGSKDNTITLRKLPSQPGKVVLLRTGQALEFDKTDHAISITVPTELRTELSDVVVVHWK